MVLRWPSRAVHAAALIAAVALPSLVASPAGAVEVGPGQWGPLVDWNNFVAVHLAVGPTGDVLMWDRQQGLTTARRWNPTTGAFSSTPGLPTALFCAFQTRLPDGTLAVVGGTAYKLGNTGLEQMQFFNWNTNSWTAGPSMHTPRWYPTVVELPDGRLFATGGQVKPGLLANVPELYDPSTNIWTELAGLVQGKAPGLYPRAILAPNGKIFVVKNALGQSAYVDVDTQTWIPVTKAPPVPPGGGMAMYDTGKILYYGIGSSDTDSYVIDLNATNPVWRKVGSLHFARKKFSTVLLPDGRVMAIGGSTDGTSDVSKAVMTPEIWDPATEQWSSLPDLAVPRMYHSNALLLPDGRVLSAGGGRDGSAPNFPSSQVYSPQYLLQPDRPSITGLSSSVWQPGATVDLTVSSANGVSAVVLMGLPGVTHSIDTQQRRLSLVVTSPYDAGTGRISVRVPASTSTGAGHYYAIALDARGVPTPAKIVQLAVGSGASAQANVQPVVVKAAIARVVKQSAEQDKI
jgi:hypothetical protein